MLLVNLQGGDSVSKMRKLGKAWVLLGVLRLQLLAPSSGIDPAAIPSLRRDAVLHEAEAWLGVEKRASLPSPHKMMSPESVVIEASSLCTVHKQHLSF